LRSGGSALQRKKGWTVVASATLAVCFTTAGAENLLDVYNSALRSDPIIREANARRNASMEAKPQAWSYLLPQLRVVGTGTHDELTRTDVTQRQKTQADVTGYAVQLSQSVFDWAQWMVLKRADTQVAQAAMDYRISEQDLIYRTALRYFDVLAAQETVEASEAAVTALERQLDETQKRFAVGLSAVTDVEESRSARDIAVADLIAAKRVLARTWELLRELTDTPISSLAAPSDEMPLEPPQPQNPEAWVTEAVAHSPVLNSTRLGATIAEQEVKIAKAEHLPTLALVASQSRSLQAGPRTTATASGISYAPADLGLTDRSISLQLSVPLYSGGYISSRVREREHLESAANDRVERVTRETEHSIRDAYLGVLSGISRVTALKQAVSSSKTALQATEKGFAVGTRTTVDVLNARRRLYEAQTSYARTRYDYIVSRIVLKLTAGTLTGSDLAEINDWLLQ